MSPRIGIDDVQVFVSAVPEEARETAVSGIQLGRATQAATTPGAEGYLTSLRPFLEEHTEIYAARDRKLEAAREARRQRRANPEFSL